MKAAMWCPDVCCGLISDPVGALKATRASTSMQPKQAPAHQLGSRPPGLHAGTGHSFSEVQIPLESPYNFVIPMAAWLRTLGIIS